MFSFIPISETALSRSSSLLPWMKSWTRSDVLEVLEPEGWFERGHDLVQGGTTNFEGHWMPKYKAGKYLWVPPPAAADVAIEELRKARHKRQESTHLFVVPRLMCPTWHKQLCKAADIVLYLPPGHSAWPSEMHEPLTVGICFPYLSYRPWELRRSAKLLDLGRNLHEVWKGDASSEGSLLRELWELPKTLERVPQVVARQMLRSVTHRHISHSIAGKRRRDEMEEEKGRGSISASKKR